MAAAPADALTVVPDWFYSALEAFQGFMDRGSFTDTLLLAVLSVVGVPLVVLVHELGHALAVRVRGLPLRELTVGDTPDLTISTAGFRLQLGRQLGRGDVGGYVLYEGSRATPMDLLVIALAGPAANLLAAVATGMLAAGLWSHGMVSVILWLMTLAGVLMLFGNLNPTGEPVDDAKVSDGRWAQIAWRTIRSPAVPAGRWEDPNAATSVAPQTPKRLQALTARRRSRVRTAA